jgi:ribosome-binding factor A
MGRSRGPDPSLRQLRVGEEVRHALVQVLSKCRFSDPVLAAANITVTEVKVSPDLKNATAFIMPLGGADLQATVAAFNRAAGFLRGQLGHEVELRHTPRLEFAADRTFDHATRVQDLLAAPRVRRDLAGGPDAAEGVEGDDDNVA